MTELLNTLDVQTPGTSLHLDGDTVPIFQPAQEGRRILPLARIDYIVLFGGVTITDDLLLRCADARRTVSWLTGPAGFGREWAARPSGTPCCARPSTAPLRTKSAGWPSPAA